MTTVLLVLVVVLLAAIPGWYLMFNGMSEIKAMVIRDVDLSKIPDGVYRGSYHKGRWTYDVEVDVRDHEIVSVKNLNPRMDVAKSWNDQAAAKIVEQQSIAVDVISGATVNTKAFEKAVERALRPARGEG